MSDTIEMIGVCESCHAILGTNEIEGEPPVVYHVVAVDDGHGEPEPVQCGPVVRYVPFVPAPPASASDYFIPETSGDWPEDFSGENGQYQNKCTSCGKLFIGHKRRVTCKVCANPAPPASDDVREIDEHVVDRIRAHGILMDEDEIPSIGFALTRGEAAALIQAHYAPNLAALTAKVERMREALLVILDAVDYKVGNCSLSDPVGAALPEELITIARAALADEEVEKCRK
jgi:hypothetical protein